MDNKILEELINQLHTLPGISKKQAEKIALNIVLNKKIELVEAMDNAINNMHKCQECHLICEESICSICQDTSREKILIIVETSMDVFKFEKSLTFKPYYHVLEGLINVSKNIDFANLNITELKSRASKYGEIILALSPSLEGLVTASYLTSLLEGMKVTQLAQGIPLGAAMEYVDELTLKAALENRKEVKK